MGKLIDVTLIQQEIIYREKVANEFKNRHKMVEPKIFACNKCGNIISPEMIKKDND